MGHEFADGDNNDSYRDMVVGINPTQIISNSMQYQDHHLLINATGVHSLLDQPDYEDPTQRASAFDGHHQHQQSVSNIQILDKEVADSLAAQPSLQPQSDDLFNIGTSFISP